MNFVLLEQTRREVFDWAHAGHVQLQRTDFGGNAFVRMHHEVGWLVIVLKLVWT